MRDLFRANLRRDLVTAAMLLVFASMAMAAAQWGTFSAGEKATLTGERDVAFMADVDYSLPSEFAAAPRVPMFTTGRSPIDDAPPADPVLPPVSEAAVAAVASSAGGFGTWSAIGTSWHAPSGFGGGDSSPFLRGASSASSHMGSIAGMSGGGAWGGVSGTAAAKSNQTIVAGASAKVVTSAPAQRTSSPARTSNASSPSPGTAASLAAAARPAFFSEAAGPFAQSLPAPTAEAQLVPAAAAAAQHGQPAAAFQHGSSPTLADPAPAGHPPHDSPSSAPTPEPLSFILVGVGLAGIYAVRKHLR
jgi:hypothetical protein